MRDRSHRVLSLDHKGGIYTPKREEDSSLEGRKPLTKPPEGF